MQRGQSVYNVLDFKAANDGISLCTVAIQTAIDHCGAGGGGTVYFPPGTYRSGTLRLRSFVELYLEAGATLLGSPDQADYPVIVAKVDSRTNHYNLRSLIFAEDLEHIAITGRGAIDGNGSHFFDRRHDGARPLNLRIVNCREVRVEGISIGNSGFWNQHYLACETVMVRGVTVWNHATYNVDAIDVDGCRDFFITDCVFDSDDDAVCLKSTLNRPCENIHISNCRISSHCNAIKLGTDSTGGFTDVTISNCTITAPRGSKALYGLQQGICGIALELVDGGRMERVVISNIAIDGVEVPLFIRLGARGVGMFPSVAEQETAHGVGSISGVSIQNVIATRAGQTGCSITGIPGHDVENVSLTNVSVARDRSDSGSSAMAPPPEQMDKYPEATMFGVLPAFGLFCRHVRDLTLTNVNLSVGGGFEHRPALIFDDVKDADVQGLQTTQTGPTSVVTRMHNSRSVLFQGCRVEAGAVLLEVTGAESTEIALTGNAFRSDGPSVRVAPDVPRGAVRLAGNVGSERVERFRL